MMYCPICGKGVEGEWEEQVNQHGTCRASGKQYTLFVWDSEIADRIRLVPKERRV